MTDTLLRDLGHGLILRRGTPADGDRLAAFNAMLHGDRQTGQPDERVGVWTRDLLTLPHPTMSAGNFTIVEDTGTGEIVSTLCLIPQTWAYEGIEFGFGRPELVGTLPEYRARGLVRAQFEVIHRWCAERGLLVQGITGIAYFYRQFGYEMCVNLGGSRGGLKDDVPALKEGQEEPYHVRPATEADAPTLAVIYDASQRRHLVSCVRGEAMWRYDLCGRSEKNVARFPLCIIETPVGEPVGFLGHDAWVEHSTFELFGYELKPGVSWAAVTPSVLRYLKTKGEELAQRDQKPFQRIAFGLGAEHPVYTLTRRVLPIEIKPYAWYIRVADLPGFLRLIAPVLERRLAESIMVGHTGEVKLGFYRDGVRLVFETGQLATVECWKPTPSDGGMARFPNLTFLQLLFGHRNTEELAYAYADCSPGNDEVRTLLGILFPKKASQVWGVA